HDHLQDQTLGTVCWPTGSRSITRPRRRDKPLDLGEVRKAAYLDINQREWSPTHNRETFGRKEDSARIKNYTVSASDDGVHWRQVKEDVLESARGVRFIDLGEPGGSALETRYLKLDVADTWAEPTVSKFYKKLQIDEIQVGFMYPKNHS
ncbi:hypothetical protein ACIQFZ_41200, partial [Streptomyces sp. NPDC093064]